jgi:hypothetical protein
MSREDYVTRCAELRVLIAIFAHEVEADPFVPTFVSTCAPVLLERVAIELSEVERLAETRH